MRERDLKLVDDPLEMEHIIETRWVRQMGR